MRISDWSSDVCSSDLGGGEDHRAREGCAADPLEQIAANPICVGRPLEHLFFPHPVRPRLPSHNLYKTNCVLGLLPIDYKSNALSIANLWPRKDAPEGAMATGEKSHAIDFTRSAAGPDRRRDDLGQFGRGDDIWRA